MMTAKQIFSKTMPFVWAKLLLGLATVLLSAVLLVILMGIGWLFGEGGMFITFCIWVGGTGFIRFAIMHYMGYLVKAGHIAVIAEAVTTGRVPDNQVAYGKARVTERFLTSNIYFAVDKLVTAAVKQIQHGIEKVGNALDFVPGMKAVSGLAQFFVSISLGYIDECCLGYTFYKKEQGAFQSAADGVVIYAQNWKVLLGSAAKTMLKVLLLMLLALLVVFIPVGLIFKLLHWSALIAFLLACLIVWVLKFALIDSYIMIQMMTAYMGVAPTTQITFDLYGKLCNLSAKFKELFQKGQEEAPQPAYAGASAGQTPTPPTAAPTVPMAQPAAQSGGKPVFCGQCGAKNEAGTKFCGSCGAKMG
ncbi:MAG: zinc ribbon domain-containing protein [Clostridium sp.]|nr:zinc ribbon domain-containing protein [Clostridium sp.]